ncbi:putative dsRNA-binding protein [Streptomyces sp. NPDC006430]|uniref:putative dsRNA-binding protein n=1 Tax=Streptomyces sp. NPDC006430 TaxID=3154299 RepID=UPI0033AE07CF
MYHNTESTSSGKVSKNVGEILSSFSVWAAEQEWVRNSAALSAGLDSQQLPPKVSGDLVRQLLGALCLENEENLAARLLRDLFESVRRNQECGIADAKTTLQEYLGGREAALYEYEQGGPDHATVFRAVVTDSKGRKGTGDGRSKKAAAQHAALDFLQRHADPALFRPVNRSARRLPALEIPGLESHNRTVRRVQELFSLPVTARPLICQALVHASWAYENRSAIAKCGQQDHQVLAHVGSWVLIYEHYLAVARHAVANPSEHPVFATLPDRIYDTAFYETGLPSALLLGVGQKAKGVPEEVGSNTFQALIGAVAATTGFTGSLAGRWPKEWSQVWQLLRLNSWCRRG